MVAPVQLRYQISATTMSTATAPIFVIVNRAMLGLIVKFLPQAMQQLTLLWPTFECCYQLVWESQRHAWRFNRVDRQGVDKPDLVAVTAIDAPRQSQLHSNLY